MPRGARVRAVPEDDRQAAGQVSGLRQDRPRARSRAAPGSCSRAAASTSPTTARTARARARPSPRSRPARARPDTAKAEREAGAQGRASPTAKPAAKADAKPARRKGRLRVSDALRAELARVASRLGADGVEFVLERPRDAGHGDLATNLAMVLAKRERANPAQDGRAGARGAPALARAWSRGPRSPAPASSTSGWPRTSSRRRTARILDAGRRLRPQRPSAPGLKVNVEFVSANPTGPLHVGHGRGAALGDAIAVAARVDRPRGHPRVLHQRRRRPDRPAGRRASGPACSEPAGQRGRDSRGRLPRRVPPGERARGARARGRRLRRPARAEEGIAPVPRARRSGSSGEEQDRDLADFGVRFDVMTSEQAIYDSAARSTRALELLARARPHLRGRRRALAPHHRSSATTRTGCCGRATAPSPTSCPTSPTTSTSTTAASTARSTSGAPTTTATSPGCARCSQALGYPPEFFDVALVQLVKVVRGGEEVKMSKRAGEFVTLRDLYEEVGVDAARYFFLMRKGDSPLDLRRRPRQAADRREPGLLRADGARPPERHLPHGRARRPRRVDRRRSTSARSRRRRTPSCSRSWSTFPEVVEKAAREREPHRITVYLHELATRRARLVSPHPRGRRARGPGHRAGPAAARPRRAHRPGQRARPARHLRPRPDVT